MVDGTGLENRHTRKGIGGSNPSLSAITFNGWHLPFIARSSLSENDLVLFCVTATLQ